jgi:tRNA-2-methylthio-N6-dimethylallyladenosine synthase
MLARRTVKVFTFGCQMNVYDSQRLVENLASIGFAETHDEEEADLVVLNTCSVREKPAQKVYSMLGRLRRLKQSRPSVLLAVAGCVAQQEQERLASRIPYVDIVLGPDHVSDVADLVEQADRTGKQVIAASFRESRDGMFPAAVRPLRRTASAYVTVMKGCDQFCSYCIVPHVRGREFSKPPGAVLDEVRLLVDSGVREVTLLGQNVNRYGMDDPSSPRFPELLERVHEVPGLERLRFTTSHPADCTQELIAAFARLEKLCPYMHLPLQSGSDRILAAMNRRYTLAEYRDRVAGLRRARPGIHLSTDLIVGFPGETQEDFEGTLEAARQVRWGSAFSFKYSPRPGTRAAETPDDVPAREKQERLARLQELLYATAFEAMRSHVGQQHPVLVEGASRKGANCGSAPQISGRTPTNYVVNIPLGEPAAGLPLPEDMVGRTVTVTVVEALPHSLLGRIEENAAEAAGGQAWLSK